MCLSTFRWTTLRHLSKLQADDWLMILVLVPYTASIVLANEVGKDTSLRKRKLQYVDEEMQILSLWLVKACLLVLYWRIS
jgi:hypothetical protein